MVITARPAIANGNIATRTYNLGDSGPPYGIAPSTSISVTVDISDIVTQNPSLAVFQKLINDEANVKFNRWLAKLAAQNPFTQ